MSDQANDGVLGSLYAHLGGALEAEHRLGAEDQQALQQIEARERELQAARAAAEGDERQLQAIDSELRELTEAYQTITRNPDAAHQPDDQAPRAGRQHDRDGDVPGDR